MSIPARPAGETRPLIEICRTYRDARSRYATAFARGDVNAIEDTFSRMQEISSAFHDGARWAEQRNNHSGEKAPR